MNLSRLTPAQRYDVLRQRGYRPALALAWARVADKHRVTVK